MTASVRRRGRPKGTGIDDSTTLARIAALMAANQTLKPTTAIKAAGITDPSVVRRLREKLKDAPVASAVKKLSLVPPVAKPAAAAAAASTLKPVARETAPKAVPAASKGSAKQDTGAAASPQDAARETPPPKPVATALPPAMEAAIRAAMAAAIAQPRTLGLPPQSTGQKPEPATQAAAPPVPPLAPPASPRTSPPPSPGPALPFPAFPGLQMFGPLVQLGFSTMSALMNAHTQFYQAVAQQHPFAASMKQQNQLMTELIQALDRHTEAMRKSSPKGGDS